MLGHRSSLNCLNYPFLGGKKNRRDLTMIKKWGLKGQNQVKLLRFIYAWRFPPTKKKRWFFQICGHVCDCLFENFLTEPWRSLGCVLAYGLKTDLHFYLFSPDIGLLRYILYTCPKLWCNTCWKCYGMDCFGTYFTHVQTCEKLNVGVGFNFCFTCSRNKVVFWPRFWRLTNLHWSVCAVGSASVFPF